MFFKRYFAQEHEWDCSPVAIINALIWLQDKPCSNSQVREEAIITCNTDKDGTFDEDMVEALEISIENLEIEASISRFESDQPNPKSFAEMIKEMIAGDDRALILGHREIWDKEGEWHHSFWFKSFKVLFWRFYVGINLKAGKRYSIVTEKTFDRICTEADEDGPVTAWVLQKTKEDDSWQ